MPERKLAERGPEGSFRHGADDHLTKPFSSELLARLRALARRGSAERPSVLAVGSLQLDPATHEVLRGQTEISLSAREFALLETFIRHPGQVFSQDQLLDAAWDLGYEARSNVVEVYVRYLREKIDRPFGVEAEPHAPSARASAARLAAETNCLLWLLRMSSNLAV